MYMTFGLTKLCSFTKFAKFSCYIYGIWHYMDITVLSKHYDQCKLATV